MKKLLILLLLAIPALAQTSKNGRVQVGPFAIGPGAPIPCSPSDQWNTTDGHGAYICITTNTWQQIGGGGNNYQIVQSAGVSQITEPKLNFVNIPCVDNPGNTSTDCTASYQFVLNNATTLPQEPRINCVPPLLCVDNPANTRTDLNCPTAVGVGGSHASGCVPDPGAVGSTTDYLGRDMLYHTSGSASTVKPDPSVGVQYVAVTCNGGGACSDTNDGLTWGTAKQTVYAALLALPSGSSSPPTSGAGVVNVASNTNGAGIPFGGPVPNQGWWIFGPTDPNYAGGLNGWMRTPSGGLQVTVQCATPMTGAANNFIPTCVEFWGGSTDNVHPSFWFSGFAGGVTLRGFLFNFRSNTGKIGIDSNNNRQNGSEGVSSVWLDQVAMNPGNCASNQGAGPALDIGGNTFWIYLTGGSYGGCITEDYAIQSISRTNNVVTVTVPRNIANDVVAGNNAQVLIRNVNDPTYNGMFTIATASGTTVTYNQTGANSTSSGGQLFSYGAAAIGIANGTGAGAGFIYLDRVTFNNGGVWAKGGFNGVGMSANHTVYEGGGGGLDMSVFEVAGAAGDTAVFIDDVQIADNSVPICGVESLANPASVTASNTSVCGSLSPGVGAGFVGTASGFRQGGFGGASSPRFDPVAVRFPNIIGPPSSWNIGGLTMVTGQLANDGTNGAATITNNSGGLQTVKFGGTSGTPQVGSSYVFGMWIRQITGFVVPRVTLNDIGEGGGDYCQGTYLSSQDSSQQSAQLSAPGFGDGQWNWYSGVCKITAAPTTGLQQLFLQDIPATYSFSVYGPVLALVPAGTITDNEVWAMAAYLASYPSNASAGDVAMMPGQHLRTDDVALNPITAPTGATGSTHVYMDVTANWPSFKPNGNTAYIVPGFTGTWTAGQCATATATVNVFNLGTCGTGGGGNVTNALLNSFAIYTAPGTSNQIGGVAGPTAPASVPQFITYTPNGTLSGAPSVQLAGIPVRSNSSSGDTIFATDRNSLVMETNATPGQVVNISSGLFNNGFAFKMGVRSLNGTWAVTPSTGTCNGSSACTLLQGQNAIFTLDAGGANLLADVHDPPLVAGSGILITRGDYSETISAPGAVGATGTPALNNLTCWSAPTTITNCNLSGDATTANTGVVTVGKVNGSTYPAGGALGLNLVPVSTGVAAFTYEAVPNAALANSSVTYNGQAVALGATGNVNAGAATHGIALNEGNGNAISGIAALAFNQIPVGVASADPVAGNISELSSAMYGVDNGAANAMTACPTNAPASGPAAAALHNGMIIEVLPANANSIGGPTLNWCGLGAKPIKSFGANLNNNDYITTANAIFLYDGTNMELLNPQTNKVATPPTWDAIGSAANNATFNNGAFTTTFNQTSNVNWVWANTTVSTNATIQPAPQFNLRGTFCTVATTCGSTNDTWTIRQALTTALNPPSTLVISQSGSTGFAAVQVPNLVDIGTLTATAITGSGAATFSAAGASAVPGLAVTGAPFTGGNGTTDIPQLYLNAGTAPTTWSLSGTEFGINTPNAFTGNLFDARVNGGSSVASVNYQGNATFAGTLTCSAATCLGSDTATTQATKTNNTTVATTAYVDAPTQLTTGSSVTLTAPRQYFVCTTTCTVTVPVPAAGYEFCVMNDDNVSTVITLAAIGSSARYENTARSAYGTAGTGTFVSGGAVADKVCIVGRDATHYLTVSFNGTWTAN